MMSINSFANVPFLLLAILFSAISECSSALSDKRLCYDPKCSEPVSFARTTLKYTSKEKGLISVPVNVEVTVYSKGAGNRSDLWGIEYNGVRGYISKSFLRESRVLKKNLTHEVPIEDIYTSNSNIIANNIHSVANTKQDNKKENKLDSTFNQNSDSDIDVNTLVQSSVEEEVEQSVDGAESASYDVVDGTTIFQENTPPIEPVATETLNSASEQPSNIISTNVQSSTTSTKFQSQTTELPLETTNYDLKSVNLKTEKLQLEETKKFNNIILNNMISDEIKKDETIVKSKSQKDIDMHISLPEVKHENSSRIEAQNNVEVLISENNSENSTEYSKKIKKDETTVKSKSQKDIDIHTSSPEVKQKEVLDENSSRIDAQNNVEVLISENNSENSTEYSNSKVNLNVEPTSDQTLNKDFSVHKNEPEEESVESILVKTDSSADTCQKYADLDVLKSIIDDISSQKKDTCQVNSNAITLENAEVRTENDDSAKIPNQEDIVNNTVHTNDIMETMTNSVNVPTESSVIPEYNDGTIGTYNVEQLLQSSQKDLISEQISYNNRNLLNIEESMAESNAERQEESMQDNVDYVKTKTLPEYEDIISLKDKVMQENEDKDTTDYENTNLSEDADLEQVKETISYAVSQEMQDSDVCTIDNDCTDDKKEFTHMNQIINEESGIMNIIKIEQGYWTTLLYLSVTAVTTLLFSLGYYYIENTRRDSKLIAKINKLEKELLLSAKECIALDENLKSTTAKLNSIEDESFGSNEMVLSLKADLEASLNVRAELEDQIAVLEKDLESATEAGLELERMLREVLSSNNEVNPLAQSVEDLQARLNAQQAANESLTNTLNLKTQENEALSLDLTAIKKKCEELGIELAQVTEDFQIQLSQKTKLEENLNERIRQLEMQVIQISTEKGNLYKELKNKEAELKDLVEVIGQLNSNNIDIDKLFEVSHIKAETAQLLEERDDLKIRLSEVEGAHNLLEEHMKLVKEEVSTLSEQCKQAEKEKKDAETRLEVISNFFKEKEAQRQKEEAIWLQKQGEVMSTVERIHTMQNEIQGYKQQIEMLKREIVDQEREYKAQISALETKAHEQWVLSRQNERRLEESKAEAAQLRNRLTLIEKNINDADADSKLHRLEANGETTTSPPLFVGAESSGSPIMFTGSSGVPPPPPPSFMHFPAYLPPPLPSGSGLPPYEVGQRPPPLGGRLSSPPPMSLHHPPPPPHSSRYENAESPPPLMSPPGLLAPFNHRTHPPPFGSDHIHPPPPPPPGSILPPPLGTSHSWGEETLPPPRNSGFHQREQRARNHKGFLHSSGESLDKTHHSGKI